MGIWAYNRYLFNSSSAAVVPARLADTMAAAGLKAKRLSPACWSAKKARSINPNMEAAADAEMDGSAKYKSIIIFSGF